MIVALLVYGCQRTPLAPTPGRDPERVLIRAAMTLLGARPSEADKSAVREDPNALAAIVERYLDDPRFGETIRDMHGEQLHLRWDVNDHLPSVGDLEGYTASEITTATDEAPLKLIEWVVTEGRPYSEIITSDVVFSNEITSIAYGLPFDPSGPDWQETHWPDGRPAGGILVDNGLWFRFPSSSANFQRSRGALAAELVCDLFAERPLSLDIFEPSDPQGVSEDPTCLACHSALDPLSSTFWGARLSLLPNEVRLAYDEDCPSDQAYACYPISMWDPALDMREELGLPAPSWYGTPVADLGDLGRAISGDPRFASCTARRFYSWFSQTPVRDVPFEIWGPLGEQFTQGGLDARALARDIALHPALDQTLTARPEQYARLVTDLTGYEWMGNPDGPYCEESPLGCQGEVDLARNDFWGNHTLMGGADGFFALDPNYDPSPVRFLSQSWLAEEAAAYVVQNDILAEPGDRRLLVAADPLDTSDEAVQTQLVHLHQRIAAERDPDVTATEALFREVLERNTPPQAPRSDRATAEAWGVVVTALLLDAGSY